MTSNDSRHGLLKRRSLLKLGAVGAGAATAVGATPPGRARAAVLDASFTSPDLRERHSDRVERAFIR